MLVVRREERKGTKRAREKLRADPVASKKPSVPEGPGTLITSRLLVVCCQSLAAVWRRIAAYSVEGFAKLYCGGTVITDIPQLSCGANFTAKAVRRSAPIGGAYAQSVQSRVAVSCIYPTWDRA